MSINKENIEEHIFDYLEGNLSEKQISEFRDYINSDNEAKSDLDYWKQSYVSDNIRMDSSEFSNLKKSNKIYYWATGIAATLLLIVGVYNYTLDDEVNEAVVEVEPIETSKKDVFVKEIAKEPSSEIEVVESEKTEHYIMPEEKSSKVEIVETAVKEDLSKLENRSVELQSSESERSIVKKKVVIEKENKASEKKKKREVDVIELNSEGF